MYAYIVHISMGVCTLGFFRERALHELKVMTCVEGVGL